MSSDSMLPAIEAHQLGKRYALGASSHRRLWQLLLGKEQNDDGFRALHGVDLEIAPGESVGIIGQNGAGKSTLLQLLCGTLAPSEGQLIVRGRVAALLELGAGFNQDFTGRENIRFSAALQGMSARHIDDHMQEIIAFADIGAFIDQPVRTYSTGMYVRLAFAIATSVEPDILVIDEALSVGDGAFARKSFDRIMQLKQRGTTLLFCSHSMFQIEALCKRCIWLNQGQVMAQGDAARVIAEYNDWLSRKTSDLQAASGEVFSPASPTIAGTTRFTDIRVRCNGLTGLQLEALSGESDLAIEFGFTSDPNVATPNLAVVIHGADGRAICSTGNWIDGIELTRDAKGLGRACISFPRLPLLKGSFTLSAYLMCERAIHIYDAAMHFATLQVTQTHLEQGLFSIPHRWQTG